MHSQAFLKLTGLEGRPIFAFGVSAGASFASKLPKELALGEGPCWRPAAPIAGTFAAAPPPADDVPHMTAAGWTAFRVSGVVSGEAHRGLPGHMGPVAWVFKHLPERRRTRRQPWQAGLHGVAAPALRPAAVRAVNTPCRGERGGVDLLEPDQLQGEAALPGLPTRGLHPNGGETGQGGMGGEHNPQQRVLWLDTQREAWAARTISSFPLHQTT